MKGGNGLLFVILTKSLWKRCPVHHFLVQEYNARIGSNVGHMVLLFSISLASFSLTSFFVKNAHSAYGEDSPILPILNRS